jgi:hypothetical protein
MNNTQAQPQYIITPADKERIKNIQYAWKAFDGELTKPLVPDPELPDCNVMSNRCQAIVERGRDFLFGKEVQISLEKGSPPDAQTFIDDTWLRKEKRIPLLQKLEMNGAMAGQAFIRIVPTKAINNNSHRVYKLINLDPQTVYVQTDPQDCESPILFCIQYCLMEMINGKSTRVTYREEISLNDPTAIDDDEGNPMAATPSQETITWNIQHWTRIGNGEKGDWSASGNPYTWPYTFPPIFYTQNLPNPNSFWGYADLTRDLINTNASINLTESDINQTNTLLGNPLIYSTGTGFQDLSIARGRITELPNPDSKIAAVTIGSDLTSARAFAGDLRTNMDEQSSVPGVATGRLQDIVSGATSGVAIELMFMPITMKTDTKRCLYGDMIIQVTEALLILEKFSPLIKIELAWQKALPADGLADVQAGIAKLEIGVSKTTVLREMGYDPEEELELNQSADAVALANFLKGSAMPPPLPGTKPLPGQEPVSAVPGQPVAPVAQPQPAVGA